MDEQQLLRQRINKARTDDFPAIEHDLDFINSQTELMVLVTPYVVRAVAQKDLSRPDDGFSNASDPQSDLLGSINRIYGVPGRGVEPARNYRGNVGFITD